MLPNGAFAHKPREPWGCLAALLVVCRDKAKPPTPCPRNGSDREVWERSQALPSARERPAVSLMDGWQRVALEGSTAAVRTPYMVIYELASIVRRIFIRYIFRLENASVYHITCWVSHKRT